MSGSSLKFAVFMAKQISQSSCSKCDQSWPEKGLENSENVPEFSSVCLPRPGPPLARLEEKRSEINWRTP